MGEELIDRGQYSIKVLDPDNPIKDEYRCNSCIYDTSDWAAMIQHLDTNCQFVAKISTRPHKDPNTIIQNRWKRMLFTVNNNPGIDLIDLKNSADLSASTFARSLKQIPELTIREGRVYSAQQLSKEGVIE